MLARVRLRGDFVLRNGDPLSNDSHVFAANNLHGAAA